MSRLNWGNGRIELVLGDITHVEADVLVTAANAGLCGGGGVDGAIHAAGGPEILAECRRIGGCPTGRAVATTAGRLPARWVIHAVGPIWGGGQRGEPELLGSAYRESLELAASLGARSIALPSISTGVYGYPVGEAADVALDAACAHLERAALPEVVRFVLFDRGTYAAYEGALARRGRDQNEIGTR
jgi:O-acetyl-ADP-ribose deacetylase (regulator of RNase III)